ncbi:hypothetical protein NEDG_01067 [Nematocida displodere]|uniref:Uncharacterized protein n=1 Tax=Nematocida displodere TaxID=1805483 RepID=A0A177EAV5_9MICR|nr:hypothetical protein NEDG_01067 [Nematocida displodere]
MRDRTLSYTEAVNEAAAKRAARKITLSARLKAYTCSNAHIDASSEDATLLSLVVRLGMNYLETRVCAYQQSIKCMECCRDVYICGMNCKLCGKWVCTACAVFAEGVDICQECCHCLSEKPANDIDTCSAELLEAHRALNRCVQRPSRESIGQLAQMAESLENNTDTQASQIIRKNLCSKIKVAVCKWYVFQAQKERYHLLLEQLDYLIRFKTENPEHQALIDESISELLQEVAENSQSAE